MNLLTDAWLPVLEDKSFRRIKLRDVLCSEADWEISLPRDDMELAAIQLLVSLTQVLFPVQDQSDLIRRIKSPLSIGEFEDAVSKYRDWFDLDHPDIPFMQIRGVSAKEFTPIQKLFVGLPEGNNHKFFNAEGEISRVCGGCAAIALFNQASNSPNFGGRFMGSLRGGGPVTTLIDAPSLRRRIWENVLPLTEVSRLLPGRSYEDRPVWVDRISKGTSVAAASIGLMRGLFWQPSHVELLSGERGACDHCGGTAETCYVGFNKERFTYQLEGFWPHPHGPRQWEEKKGERVVRFLSFTTTAPAWTQLTQMLVLREEGKEGYMPAAVVSSRRKRRSGGPLHLLVGGYWVKKSSVVERRHELFSFSPGWEEGGDQIAEIVHVGFQVASLVKESLKLASVGKKRGFKGIGVQLYKSAEQSFYHSSQNLIHSAIQDLDYDGFQSMRAGLVDGLNKIASALYQEAVAPYQHDPEFIQAISAGRARLASGLRKLRGDYVRSN